VASYARAMRVDLRSDTVTRPTPAMRRAMAEAEVGDDGYGEDPTVARLEARVAELTGKEAALFVPSGTMANQIALCLLAAPGTAVVAGRRCHIVNHELGAAARNALVQFATVDDRGGLLDLAAARLARAGADHHQVPVSAVTVENTAMAAGGAALPVEHLEACGALGVPLHLDGARLCNASVATGVPVDVLARPATTVMCCLSKGLAAPVGSVLSFPAELAGRARAERKRLGGAMRQAGVLAAAGLVALDTMVDRLADDHARAAVLAQAVEARWPGSARDPGGVATNMVVFRHDDPDSLLAALASYGVLAGTIAPGVVRLVTHADVDDAAVDHAVAAIAAAP
jgi:threonine aldolase